MKRTIWTPTLAWLAAAAGALMLAGVAPSETDVMGRLPAATAERVGQQRIVLPRGLSAERSLALVGFEREQHEEIDSWIQGLRLEHDDTITWFKMPVLNDPGDPAARSAIEYRILARQPTEQARSRLVPVFTNREAFIRAAGLSGARHASVLVLDREGKVLARAEGRFDNDKALALRATLAQRR